MDVLEAPDFDRIIDRRNTGSAKWDTTPEGCDPAKLLPMWVADMDFQAPRPVISAVREVVDHGVFGYSIIPESLHETYISWVFERYGVRLNEEWLLCSGGVLKALALVIRTLTEPGDGVILQPPVYHPLAPLLRNNQREVVENPLIESEGVYAIDLDHLDSVAEKASALLLCNPHNPVGRVFKQEELQAVLEICSRRGLIVISDEIHSDIIMRGNFHIPLYSFAHTSDVPVVALTSHTKTFNIAGIPMAWIIAPDGDIRKRLKNALTASHDGKFSHFAVVAALAAYSKCSGWLDAVIAYVEENRTALAAELEAIEGVRLSPLEGTYLAWIDFRNTGIDPAHLQEAMLKKAGLRLNSGEIFGEGGAGFQRLNLATQRSRVLEAGRRIRAVFG